MADLKLKRVVLRNWGKFHNAELQFPESGLVMVTGANLASGGAMQSVGSGKTLFGESFSRALLGIKGRFEHMKQFSRDKKGDTYVRVEADLLGKPLIVENGFQCEEINPRAEGLRFSYDGGKEIERGTIAETRAELTKLIGVPSLLASWTVFVNGKKMDFTQLNQEDCVDLVMSALRQPPWNDYHERVKVYVRNFNKTLIRDETAHEQALSHLEESKADVGAAQTEVTEAQQEYNDAKAKQDEEVKSLNKQLDALSAAMQPLQKRQKELAASMKQLEESKATEHHRLEIQQRDLQEAIRELKVKAKPLLEVQTAAQRMANAAETNFTNYRDVKRVCPTCKKPLDALDPEHLTDLEAKYDAAAAEQEQAEQAYSKVYRQVEAKAASLQQVGESINQLGVKFGITTLSEEHEENDGKLDGLSGDYSKKELRLVALEKGPADGVLNTAKAKLVERQRVVEKAEQTLKEAAEALATSKLTERLMNYWSAAFSPYGIPNMVLRDAIAPLNHEARRISASMTGGTIEVVYSTAREMASGATKARLNIEVNNLLGDKDLAGCSNGEAGLTNLVISETLGCVGQIPRRIGFKWLDEVIVHQDAVVCKGLYSYMHEIAQRQNILIFLVDHNSAAANYADYFLTVKKEGNVKDCYSTVEWRS